MSCATLVDLALRTAAFILLSAASTLLLALPHL